MEVPFAPDVLEDLQRVASDSGKNPAPLVQDTVSHMLERRARFLGALDRGIASADRGDFLEHEEVLKRIDRLFQS
jgi:predicted transcriptional regulator